MRFKPAIWFPIAAGLSVVNLAAVWFAAVPAEPWHAAGHAGLAVAFGLWAQRLRQRRREGTLPAGVGALELEVDQLRRELIETQERLDFAERIMAQNPEYRRVERDG